MTLIACTRPDIHPVFFADTLLSSESGRDVVLPSVGIRHRQVRPKTKFLAWGYDEKIVILHNSIIIAWAGDFDVAKKIIGGVDRFFEGIAPTLQYFEAYLVANHPSELNQDISMIVAIRETDRIALWRHQCEEWVIPPIGTIWLAGSGVDRAKKYLRQMPPAILRAGNDLRVGIATSLALGGSLLADEMCTGAPLMDNFGGAYEIASFVLDRPVKIDDFAFVFWFVEIGSAGLRFELPRKVMRRYERDGQTCYYCIEFDPSKMPLAVAKEEVFIWKRFLAPEAIHHSIADIPELNTQWQVNVFCLDRPLVEIQLATHVNFRHLRSGHAITFKDDRVRGKFQLSLDQEIIREALLPLA